MSRALDLKVILHQHAVVQHGDIRRFGQFALFVESRRAENNIISLPLAGFAADVYQGRDVVCRLPPA